MKEKIVSVMCLLLSIALMCACFTSCDVRHFEANHCVTTEDGFMYYYNENSTKGATILDIPNTEELVIPEYIDDKKVVKLGYILDGLGYTKHYFIDGANTKVLTIQHQFEFCDEGLIFDWSSKQWAYMVDFPNLTNLIFMDFLYCNQSYIEEELMVPHYIGERSTNVPDVELKKSDREYTLENFKAKVILIPDYVKVIEKDVFAGLTDVKIKTSYESKPEGWEDGWNGSCEVEWGEEITYFEKWVKTTEDNTFVYYYNEQTNEGAYIISIPQYFANQIIIPEYVDGKRVTKLGVNRENRKFTIYKRNLDNLTIQHPFEICNDVVGFPDLKKLTFVDFLYCNQTFSGQRLRIPNYIGSAMVCNALTVELKRSDREYSLEDFKAKVIIIPEYVKVIEKDVFAGLTDVTIKTSYESKPEGWEDGWNGSCEVEWGVENIEKR